MRTARDMVADMYTQAIREDLIRAGVDKDHAAIDRVTDQLADQGLARKRRDGSMFESISANATKPHPGTT
jgi:hypothetical protein